MKTTFVMKNYAARFFGRRIKKQDHHVNKYTAPLKYLKAVEKSAENNISIKKISGRTTMIGCVTERKLEDS